MSKPKGKAANPRIDDDQFVLIGAVLAFVQVIGWGAFGGTFGGPLWALIGMIGGLVLWMVSMWKIHDWLVWPHPDPEVVAEEQAVEDAETMSP
jgi:hypothetical protein